MQFEISKKHFDCVKGMESAGKRFLKEIIVAHAAASVFSLLIFRYNNFIPGEMNLTFSVSVAMFIVIIFAAFFGTIIPLVLRRVKISGRGNRAA